ncbi:hypothetical protein HanLR1_Chr04g0149931 [Helianthus annuus]|nr:hypothetical protein HanLR1_Chr04g0149931 [Helianthus annuus]
MYVLKKYTYQPASMRLRWSPKEPELTHICDRLNSNRSVTSGFHTFMLGFYS